MRAEHVVRRGFRLKVFLMVVSPNLDWHRQPRWKGVALYSTLKTGLLAVSGFEGVGPGRRARSGAGSSGGRGRRAAWQGDQRRASGRRLRPARGAARVLAGKAG